MLDSRAMFIIENCVAVIIILSLTSCDSRSSNMQQESDMSRTPRTLTPSQRLRTLAAERGDYTILVGVPLSSPTEWAAVTKVDDDSLSVDGHGTLSLSDVRAFIVAYPNGQLVDYNGSGLPLPEGITGLSPSGDTDRDILQLADLRAGGQYIQIKYGRSTSRPNDHNHYSTTLTNISNEKIKINRFAGYTKTSRGWKLTTVTNKFYSAQEFQEWYGLGSDQWILPGQLASDANNYGSPPVLWAYYCESESGKQFIAGAVLP